MIALAAPVLLAAWYVWAFRAYYARFPYKTKPYARLVAFLAGCAVLAAIDSPAVDVLADRSFAWHMAEHLGFLFVAPPLLLMGAPLLYLLGTLPAAAARTMARALRSEPLATLFSPVPSWLCFVAFLWISHFSGIYNAALDHPPLHAVEHALYLTFALFFWSAIVQTGFVPHPLPFGARLLYVFLAIPQGAFLGVALTQTRGVLYAHYAVTRPAAAVIADQHDAGAVMWIAGGMMLFATFMIIVATWAAREREPALGYTS